MEGNTDNKEAWCVLLSVLCCDDDVKLESELYDGIPELKTYLDDMSPQQCRQLLAAAMRRQRDKEVVRDEDEGEDGSHGDDGSSYYGNNSSHGNSSGSHSNRSGSHSNSSGSQGDTGSHIGTSRGGNHSAFSETTVVTYDEEEEEEDGDDDHSNSDIQ